MTYEEMVCQLREMIDGAQAPIPVQAIRDVLYPPDDWAYTPAAEARTQMPDCSDHEFHNEACPSVPKGNTLIVSSEAIDKFTSHPYAQQWDAPADDLASAARTRGSEITCEWCKQPEGDGLHHSHVHAVDGVCNAAEHYKCVANCHSFVPRASVPLAPDGINASSPPATFRGSAPEQSNRPAPEPDRANGSATSGVSDRQDGPHSFGGQNTPAPVAASGGRCRVPGCNLPRIHERHSQPYFRSDYYHAFQPLAPAGERKP